MENANLNSDQLHSTTAATALKKSADQSSTKSVSSENVTPTAKTNPSPSKQTFQVMPQNQEGVAPIHLIYYDTAEKAFKVSEEARQFLSGIKERVGVIAVAGKYRTGKSFLLNRVIINKRNQGFGVGPTINPCTKGLWIWGETLEGEHQGEKLKVLLIDSEGIGAFDEDENHDTKIFLLALLLCSYFIYNSMGTIDENAINNLSLIINLSKELQIKSEVLGDCDPDEIAKYFPSFLWIVRDFSLRLHDAMGNAITAKEYFEQALQPQKGNSDQVETKNRIRRLVKHFFKDRDCYTLVRPVEDEKELQNLQSIPDDQLRAEFLQSMNQLRSKIFKRVKPKTLNSKFLTGEMLLELCYSYTQAINTGTIPNIQNAWSYVCQNECQRAINESIAQYDSEMRKILVEAKHHCNEELIKKNHRIQRDAAVSIFKNKAVGQEIQEFESQLRDGISKKHKEIRNEFLRYCKGKAHEFLENDLNNLKRNLQNDVYENMDKFKEDLDLLKQKYYEQGPQFSGRSEIISDVSIGLIVKASDYLTISSRKEIDVQVKRLRERVDELEKDKSQMKLDYQAEKKSLEQKLFDSEHEKNTSLRNEKLLEERLRYLNEDKEKSDKQINDKWKLILQEKEEQIKSLDLKYKQIELSLKYKEEENFKKQNEFEKLNALIEQKLQLTENELTEYKTKYAQKDQDYKEINKELYNSRKELQQLTNKMHSMEQDKLDEIRLLKNDYESQISELQIKISSSGGNTQSDAEQQSKWNQERLSMQNQMKIMMESLEQQKKIQETLLLAINNQNVVKQGSPNNKSSADYKKIKDKNKELLTTNQNLSQQIVQMQAKQLTLEKSITSLKPFKFMIQHAVAIQCKACSRLYPKTQYSQHLNACNRENERISTLNAQYQMQPFEINVNYVGERTFEVHIDNNLQKWVVNKTLNDFKQLFEQLQSQFPTYQLPFVPDEWLQSTEELLKSEIKKKLNGNLNELVRVPFLRSNQVFKQFIELDQNCIDDEMDQQAMRRPGYMSLGPAQLNQMTAASRISNLNPFSYQTGQNNPGFKTMDGRKSVNPMLNVLHTQQDQHHLHIDPSKIQIVGQSLNNMTDYIKELVDDEDLSSIASNNRLSQVIMDDATNSARPSIYSAKQSVFVSKTNSPFQHVQSESKKLKILVKNSNTPQVAADMQDHDFEDSVTHELSQADISLSSRKIQKDVEGLFSQGKSQAKVDENSPPHISGLQKNQDMGTAKTNLLKKFDNEIKSSTPMSQNGGRHSFSQNQSLNNSQTSQKKESTRYEEVEDEGCEIIQKSEVSIRDSCEVLNDLGSDQEEDEDFARV